MARGRVSIEGNHEMGGSHLRLEQSLQWSYSIARRTLARVSAARRSLDISEPTFWALSLTYRSTSMKGRPKACPGRFRVLGPVLRQGRSGPKTNYICI